jgi:hypothetical protein
VTSFGYNNPTIISGVQITNTSAVEINSGNTAAGLTRLNDFVLQFDVYDIDGFSNLDVYVVLFNTDSDSVESASGVMITAINSGVNDRGLVIRWIAPERGEYLSGLSENYSFPVNSGSDTFLVKSGITPISSGTYNSGVVDFVTTSEFNDLSSVTWAVDHISTSGTSTVVQSGVVNTFDQSGVVSSSGVRNIRYRVTIPFKMSKVAPSSGVWNVGVMVHDKLQQEIAEPKTDEIEKHFSYSPAYYNQWYGEVRIEGTSGISFTNVAAGSGFQKVDQSGVDSGIQVRFTSNGTYFQGIQSTTTWRPNVTIPTRPAFAYLVFNSGLDNAANDPTIKERLDQQGNRFALQARRIRIGSSNDSDPQWVNILPYDPADVASGLVPAVTESFYQQANEDQTPIASPLPSRIGFINSAEGTTEIGVVSIFEFQLRLSSVFQNTTYRGTLNVGISNAGTSTDFFTGQG